MPPTFSPYEDCFELFDRALESPRGVFRYFTDRDEAFVYRNRLNKARTWDRSQNRSLYKPGDALYNKTVYTQITVREPYWSEEKQRWVLALIKNSPSAMDVEEIPEAAE